MTASFFAEYAKTNKPRETEGFWDIYLIRPLGFIFVQLFRHTPITPNQVSFLAFVAHLIGAVFYFRAGTIFSQHICYASLGLLMMVISSGLDASDGMLARLTNRVSPNGRVIDGLFDSFGFASFCVAIYFAYVTRTGEWSIFYFLFGFFSGQLHAIHCQQVDYQRGIYRFFAYGQEDVIRDIVNENVSTNFTSGIIGALQSDYLKKQKKVGKSSTNLLMQLYPLKQKQPDLWPRIAEIYIRNNRPMLSPWTMIGPNAHKIGFVLCAFIPVGGAWGTLGSLWYFWYETVVLTLVMFALLWLQHRANRRTLQEVSQLTGLKF